MGGNALKNTETIRIDREELDRIYLNVKTKLHRLDDDSLKLVKFYKDKKDFGDIDILVKVENFILNETVQKYIRNIMEIEFGCKEIVVNGNCISVAIDQVQVDFIFVNVVDWEMANFFYSYNDMGLLLGKLAHYNRVKLGFDGLFFRMKDDENPDMLLFEELITVNPREICSFMGLSYSRWSQGFNNMEEVFDYVITSKFYCSAAFDQVNWRSDQRRRDNKRKNLGLFYDHIKNVKDVNIYKRPTYKEQMLNLHSSRLFDVNLLETYHEKRRRVENKKLAASKFNGHLIQEKYGLTGIELGNYFKSFHSIYKTGFSRTQHILNTPIEDLYFNVEMFIENN